MNKAIIAFSIRHARAVEPSAEYWDTWASVRPGYQLRICRTFFESESRQRVRLMLTELVHHGYRSVLESDPLAAYALKVYQIDAQPARKVDGYVPQYVYRAKHHRVDP